MPARPEAEAEGADERRLVPVSGALAALPVCPDVESGRRAHRGRSVGDRLRRSP